MARQWQLDTPTGRCVATGRTLGEGEEFYTVILEEGESFRRVDYSSEAWQGPPDGAYCHFKTHVPTREKRKKLLVDNEMLVSFFLRLGEETEPARVRFRFVLALMLMRKRLLRYDTAASPDGVETWKMTLLQDKSTHEVIDPKLSDDQIAGVSEQLSAILHSDMGVWAGQQESAAPAVNNQESQQDAPG